MKGYKTLTRHKQTDLTKTLTPINVNGGDSQTVAKNTEDTDMTRKKELVKNFTQNVYAKYQGQGQDKRWFTYIPDETKPNGRRKVARTNEEDLDDVIVEYCEKEAYGKTIGQLYREYYDNRQAIGKVDDATRIAYDTYFKKWYLKTGYANKYVTELTPRSIGKFLKDTFISEGGMTSRQYSKFKTPLRGALQQAYDDELIEFTLDTIPDPIKRGDYKTVEKDPNKEVFNHADLKAMIEYLTANLDIVNKCIFLLFISGLRVGEAVALKFSDIDIDNNCIYVRRTESARYNAKHKKEIYVKDGTKTPTAIRTVPISPEFNIFLKHLRNDSAFREWVFMYTDGQYKGLRIKTSGIRRRLSRLCDKLEMEHRTPHKQRKTFASLLDEAHIDRKTIAKIMGHKHPKTTDDFYQWNLATDNEVPQLLQAVNFGTR